MTTNTFFTYDTKLGKITIAGDGNAVSYLGFGSSKPLTGGFAEKKSGLTDTAAAQIYEYLEGKRKEFAIPLALSGTAFQLAVWNALRDIPYGEVRSYKQIAAAIGKPKAYRAVGLANNRNPISIIVPCHRVISADGSLAGYGGGIGIKKKLLEIEAAAGCR